mgnify:CR=1 FL=1
MTISSISAGESYVPTTCNNTLLLKGLQEASRKISETAKSVSATDPSSPSKNELHDWNNMKDALQDISREMEKTTSSGNRLADCLATASDDVITAPSGDERRRGDEVWDAVLGAIAIVGGNYAAVKELTYAELLTIAQARRVEEWEKAAFVVYYSINANPFLKTTIDV